MNKKSILKPFLAIGAFFSLLFGRVHWSSPPWIKGVRQQAISKPGLFWGSTVAVLLLAASSIYGYIWYKNLPQPELVTAVIASPDITPLEEDLVPNDLIINFGIQRDELVSQSVAPLKLIGKEVTEGIELVPDMPGEWAWDNDSRLIFTPEKDWPAGQTYEVRFNKEVFAANVQMEKLRYQFSTKPFEAKIAELGFYQDPLDAKNRQIVATVNFNFPVDSNSFEEKTTLILQKIKNNQLDLDAKHFKFTVSYDKYKRIAYLRSEPLSLPKVSRYVDLIIPKGVEAESGSGKTGESISKNLLIPDASNYFKVSSADASIIRNERDRPEQILNVETSLGVTEAAINKALHVYLLPKNYPATASEPEKSDYDWQNPGEVNSAILALSKPLSLQALPADRNYSSLHSYRFSSNTPQYLYLKLDKGLKGFGDFDLSTDYTAIIKVPELPKEISFLHKGALLALAGEKMLSVVVRGVPAVKFEIARVLPDNVNQLVTQTQGDFNNPYFINQSFNQQNISEIFSEIQQFDTSDLTKQNYTALDLGKYLSAQANTGGPQGLFLLQATGWDVQQKQPLDVKTSRLVLMTDLGLLAKDNNDGSHEVFVQSIAQGAPVANASVSILGKNGLPLLTRMTNEQGQASFPVLSDYVDEREPTVYLASLGSDVSFIPYNNASRQLNFSRFDVGGLYVNNQDLHSLSAYLFSDRGIYRPGDEAHFGMIIKQAYAFSQPAGLPLEVLITDPRGTTVLDKKLTLDNTGYLTLDFPTTATSPTGQYQVNLYVIKDNNPQSLLGSTSIRVAEFQPDRMRITSSFSQKPTEGWVSPDNLTAQVSLWNLYGAPAADRKISARILLSPQRVQFTKYPEYIFIDPLLDPSKPAKVFTEDLPETRTNDKGEADLALNLNRFDKATYQLTFFAEGFEAQGGRSVNTQSSVLVSPLSYFIGYKPDGDLSYIKQNDKRSVNFIAVDPQLKQLAIDGLKLQWISLRPVVTLVKNPNGSYKYQSIIQSTVLETKPFKVDEQSSAYDLPTQQIGDFAIKVLDKNNTELSQLKYSVVGNSQLPLAKNAELSVKLNKEEYNVGEDIELQITAPYTGSGLITIERDKVYASQWFKTDSSSSIQKIRIPADFQGNGYVNVAFVRNWDSPEIFISPLSYSVMPFSVNHDNRAIHIALKAEEEAKPGMPLNIEYQSDKPGKIIVFAVDEGILQVSRYVTPDPLAFFFQKYALQVFTQQTVDQILPKYIRERELSAVGGDDGEELLASHLNPFKRKTDLPVVFWSGLLPTDTTARQVTYEVPDYFNGSLRIMAVAVGDNDLGSAEKQIKVKGNFIINPNVPNFVAPGDEFDVTASVANNVKNSGAAAKVNVQMSASFALEIIGNDKETIEIDEGKEKTLRFHVKAKAELGNADLSFTASLGDKLSKMNASLSVRPASSYMTTVKSGREASKSMSLPLDRALYPEYRQVQAAVSSSPLILVAGLQRYLENYPYGCTEQITSKAWPLLAMGNQPQFDNDSQQAKQRIVETIQTLGQRQMTNGGFSYWPGLGDNSNNDFASVYAMHFLTEAREQGYNVSNDIIYYGINYLKELAERKYTDLYQGRIQAYAIYVLTRNEIITTNYLTNLQLSLEQDKNNNWQQDITGAYLASTYQLLKNFSEAERLIKQFKVNNQSNEMGAFYDSSIADAQYLYLVARHFPQLLSSVGDRLIMPLVESINANEINTVLSGYTSLALNAYAQSLPPAQTQGLSIMAVIGGQQTSLEPMDKAYQKVDINDKTTSVTIDNPNKISYFYQLIQAGFDRNKVDKPLTQGMEVLREYRDDEGNTISSVALGSEVEVHIQLRTLDNRYINNIAIVDLLPGGFEVVRDSVKTDNMEYADIREDRVIFFGSLGAEVKEISYRIKAVNIGQFTVPPVLAEAMYDPALKAEGVSSVFSVNQ
ncbi:alpha-2-macroglobulin [Legionella sp. 16cNR16C]|uniref:alpha-2-macroglobulin family protein n=1 Tax=Legionella sp. 16cNR16C TaxID=2905656 RepID=UPI001E439ADF|nr:alpha-2-macroglobulin [Legionella sp. 16cNR16C]MCE3045251.1 MG2 domain-containing protein [Legionella sp. 16cNR16C]